MCERLARKSMHFVSKLNQSNIFSSVYVLYVYVNRIGACGFAKWAHCFNGGFCRVFGTPPIHFD